MSKLLEGLVHTILYCIDVHLHIVMIGFGLLLRLLHLLELLRPNSIDLVSEELVLVGGVLQNIMDLLGYLFAVDATLSNMSYLDPL